MEQCHDCVYYLPFKLEGYNCGYLIKKVNQYSCGCPYFESLGAEAEK